MFIHAARSMTGKLSLDASTDSLISLLIDTKT
jgi:hypothetical protein